MGSKKKYSLEGANEVMKALEELPVKIQAKVIKSFLAKAGRKFVTNPLKSELNYSSQTEKSIRVVQDPKKAAVSAGVTRSGYKLLWADLGTKERTTKSGANRGKIIGKKQIQPKILNSIDPIIDYVNEELGEEINKILERRIKKINK